MYRMHINRNHASSSFGGFPKCALFCKQHFGIWRGFGTWTDWSQDDNITRVALDLFLNSSGKNLTKFRHFFSSAWVINVIKRTKHSLHRVKEKNKDVVGFLLLVFWFAWVSFSLWLRLLNSHTIHFISLSNFHCSKMPIPWASCSMDLLRCPGFNYIF